MKSNQIYLLSHEDIYTVADESFDRKPTRAEIKYVEAKIGDRIPWFEIIEELLTEYEKNNKLVNSKRI